MRMEHENYCCHEVRLIYKSSVESSWSLVSSYFCLRLLSPQPTILTVRLGLALLGFDGTSPRVSMTSYPLMILPKTTCFLSSQRALVRRIKNWEPLVSLPWVGHGYPAGATVGQDEVLIVKALSVDCSCLLCHLLLWCLPSAARSQARSCGWVSSCSAVFHGPSCNPWRGRRSSWRSLGAASPKRAIVKRPV